MRKEIPAGVLEMLNVPGLRPEKVVKLYKELGITSLAALEQAANDDRLKAVKGLGSALQTKILQGIAIGRQSEGKRHLHRAAALLRSAEQRLRQAHPHLKRITPAGEFRRGCELVSDLSLVVEAHGAEAGTMRSGSHLHIHLTDPTHYGISLLYATGSATHVEQLKALGRPAKASALMPRACTVAARSSREARRRYTPASACPLWNQSCARAPTRSRVR
jgi:DNA polymerase (family 10)